MTAAARSTSQADAASGHGTPTTIGTGARIVTCRPVEIRPATGGRFRAWCSCGWFSTPRRSVAAARDAIECEHGFSAGLNYRIGSVGLTEQA